MKIVLALSVWLLARWYVSVCVCEKCRPAGGKRFFSFLILLHHPFRNSVATSSVVFDSPIKLFCPSPSSLHARTHNRTFPSRIHHVIRLCFICCVSVPRRPHRGSLRLAHHPQRHRRTPPSSSNLPSPPKLGTSATSEVLASGAASCANRG